MRWMEGGGGRGGCCEYKLWEGGKKRGMKDRV